MNYSAFVNHGYSFGTSPVPYSTEPTKAPRGKKLSPERVARILAIAEGIRAGREGGSTAAKSGEGKAA